MEFLVVSRLKQLVQFQMRRTGMKSGVGQFIILFRLRKPRRYTVRAEVRLLYGCWYHMEFPTLQKSRTCTYDVVVTQHVANVFWWVQVPLGALLDGSANFLLHEEHEVPGSSPGLGTMLNQLNWQSAYIVRLVLWFCSIVGLMRLPVTQEIVGSNPIRIALDTSANLSRFGC